MAETDRIRVFSRNGTGLIDYGSYAHGYHRTRRAAIQNGNAARRERRELVIEAAA